MPSVLFLPKVVLSHSMDLAILRPASEFLAPEPKNHTSEAPQDDQAHIGHDGWDITALDSPRRDELRETIAPYVFLSFEPQS